MNVEHPSRLSTFSQQSTDDKRKRHSIGAIVGDIMGARKASHRHSLSQPILAGTTSFDEPYGPHISFDKRNATAPDSIRRSRNGNDDREEIWARQVALSFDGGGIRALCQLYIMQKLMNEIARIEASHQHNYSASSPFLKEYGALYSGLPEVQKSMGDGQYLPCHYFDYFAGTGMGGIVAIMLGRLRHSVATAIDDYKIIWTQLANGSRTMDRLSPGSTVRKANQQSMLNAMQSIVKIRERLFTQEATKRGSSKFVADDAMGRTLVLSMEINKAAHINQPYLFRSYEYNAKGSSELNRPPQGQLQDLNISSVSVATAAARSHFSGIRLSENGSKFYDGSIWTLNPTMELYREVESLHKGSGAQPLQLILSIGSGFTKISRPSNPMKLRRRSITVDQHPEQLEVHETLERRAQDAGFAYYRFDGPADTKSISMDEWTEDRQGEKTFADVESYVERYFESPRMRERLEACAKRLVEIRHQRAATERWERFALGIHYTCSLCAKGRRRTVQRKPAPPKNLSSVREDALGGESLQPEVRNNKRLGLTPIRVPSLYRTRSNQSDNGPQMATIDSPPGSPRRPSVASGSRLSILSEKSDEPVPPPQEPAIPYTPPSFDFRDEFMQHLQMVHEAPPPDYRWKDYLDDLMAKNAHSKVR